MGVLQDNLLHIKERVRLAAGRAGRDPRQVKIIAVTKNVQSAAAREVLEAGIVDLGENRVQEMTRKMIELPPEVRWHMIGHLQANKVKYVIGRVELIHSLDRWSLAEEINRRAADLNQTVQALVQVNVSGEESKFGLSPGELPNFLEALRDLPHICVKGLMTVAPYVVDAEEVRPYFRELRLLAGRFGLQHLSMGMTNDYEIAVEEGADMLRLGTAIFGPRIY